MFPKGKCFGTAAVGEKGQIVIPADARKAMDIKPGDKLFVFGRSEHGVLMLMKGDNVSQFINQALEELSELSATLKTSKEESEEER